MGGKSGGGSAPSPSEYIPLINAQANANRVNTYSPYSSTVFSRVPESGFMGPSQSSNKPSAPDASVLPPDKMQIAAGGGGSRFIPPGSLPGQKTPPVFDSQPVDGGVDQWQAVTSFSPELQPLFNQQIGMAGQGVGGQDPSKLIAPYINQQNTISSSPFGGGAEAFNQQSDISQNPFGVGSDALTQQMSLAGQNPFGGSQDAVRQQLAQALDPSSFNNRIESAYTQRANNILDPQFERQRRQLEQRLVDQGIPMGSEAYNEAMNRMDASQNLARENTALSAVQAGNQAALQDRGLNLNELSTAANLGLTGQGQQFSQLGDITRLGLTGQGQQYGQLSDISRLGLAGQGQQFGQVSSTGSQALGANNQSFNQGLSDRNQQFNQLAAVLGGAQTTPAQPIDVMGPANMSMNANLANQQMNANNKSSLINAGSGLGAAYLLSDRSLKKNLKAIGKVKGLVLYAFEYLWGEKSFGVMSDEVRKVFPNAVIKLPSGYDIVNYGVIYA